ncbi:MAG: hypothetical protein Q7S33_02700 [Nanoarchaeota archaeon]|nr:hypothetical protein [Nanoarchaeota archaeon]
MNKRVFALFSISLLLSIFILNLVSAATPTVSDPIEALKSFGNGFLQVFQPFFETILGTTPSGQLLFAKVLFLLLLFSIIWVVIDQIPLFSSNTWVSVLISITVSLLSTRFLTEAGWVQTILLPYSALGIAITAFLPLLIYFYFVEYALSKSRILRKAAWIFAAVIFIGLWITRYEEIGAAAWVYPTAAGLCIIFFLMDGTIQRALKRMNIERQLSPIKYAELGRLENQMEGLVKAYSNAPTDAERKSIQKLIDNLKKRIQHVTTI